MNINTKKDISLYDNTTVDLNGSDMKKIILIVLTLAILFLMACGSDPVQEETGTIEGVVYDYSTGDWVGKANIITIPPSSAVTSDSLTGFFKILHVDPGVYRVRATKIGYDSTGVNISVLAGEKTIADIALRIDTTLVDTTSLP